MTPSDPGWLRWDGEDLELRVRVQTRSRHEGLAGTGGGALWVRVKAPPVNGKANRRLRTVLGAAFGVPDSRVRLVQGTRSRHKRVRIESPKKLPEALEAAARAAPRLEKSHNPV